MNPKNIVKCSWKKLSYVNLIFFITYMKEKWQKMTMFHFSKNPSKWNSRVGINIKLLNFEPGSTQIESFQAHWSQNLRVGNRSWGWSSEHFLTIKTHTFRTYRIQWYDAKHSSSIFGLAGPSGTKNSSTQMYF